MSQRHLRLILYFVVFPSLALLALNPFAFSQEKSPITPNLSLKLTGGWGSALEENDVNRMLNSFTNNSKFVYLREHDPRAVIGELAPLDNRVSEWEAEFRMDFSRHLGLGVATSLPYRKTNEGTVRYIMFVPDGQQVHDYTYHPTILVAPPLKFTVYYSPFKGSIFRASLNGGIGIYPERITIEQTFVVTSVSGSSARTLVKTDAQPVCPLGLHGGLELELNLFRGLSLVIEGQARAVNFTNFRGRTQISTWEWFPSGELRTSSNKEVAGTLYCYTEEDFYLGARYVRFHAFDKLPDVSAGFIADIRRVRLDLSRFAIRAGLRIRLF